ncbi:MAG: ribosome maturation factor RimP [Spirochaetia bacterium]|nr:ribosome maturation factor RimP [Spirochaetia bacterium]
MEFANKSGKYYEILAPVVEGLGFRIVELSANNRQDGLHIALVLYSENGVTVNDCERVHRVAAARMEVASDSRDVYFEVSSPGVNRNIKSADEFAIFVGKRVKVLSEGESEWTVGELVAAGNDDITVFSEKTERKIPYSLIRKAKLEFSWEEA